MRDYIELQGKDVFEMFALEWNMEDALKAKYEYGIERGIEQTARRMIIEGESLEKVQRITELPIERINEIAKSINQ